MKNKSILVTSVALLVIFLLIVFIYNYDEFRQKKRSQMEKYEVLEKTHQENKEHLEKILDNDRLKEQELDSILVNMQLCIDVTKKQYDSIYKMLEHEDLRNFADIDSIN